ncbi:MAG: hypothetical protein Q7W45_17775 [Bacteroidota bacterium]|nr:hypothetical protein [Bacteroidota bacterium]MDP3146233.1 hypothetical protein [Bacteroidota bacterium]MDP3558140.1 hypothetical protein [Bacteroidota bacterium]
MISKIKYLFTFIVISFGLSAQKLDSVLKQNGFVISVYGGLSRMPFAKDFPYNSKTKNDKSVNNVLTGFTLQYERCIKSSHYILFGGSYFYGQHAIINTRYEVDQNNNSNTTKINFKINYNYYITEICYRKRFFLKKQNKYNVILDAGVYSVLHVNGNSNSFFTFSNNGIVTNTDNYSSQFYDNNKIINTKANFSFVNRLGIEKKIKKHSISLLISNYIPVIYIYGFSPTNFNPLLTFQLHV